jgi:hypothetical protein
MSTTIGTAPVMNGVPSRASCEITSPASDSAFVKAAAPAYVTGEVPPTCGADWSTAGTP